MDKNEFFDHYDIMKRNGYDTEEVSSPYGIVLPLQGMTGFDGRGWSRNASREVPTSKNPHKKSSANRTSYAAMPLAA